MNVASPEEDERYHRLRSLVDRAAPTSRVASSSPAAGPIESGLVVTHWKDREAGQRPDPVGVVSDRTLRGDPPRLHDLGEARHTARTVQDRHAAAPRGLESLGKGSPVPGVAAALARAGRPREAWDAWERGLARGIVDEATRRAARPLTEGERDPRVPG